MLRVSDLQGKARTSVLAVVHYKQDPCRVGLTFARQRVAPRVTQAYLGHSDITITLSYYQDVDENDLREAGSLLC